MTYDVTVIVALLGSTRGKAALKTLMKLTPVVSFFTKFPIFKKIQTQTLK